VSYPPRRIWLAGFKEERQLLVFAGDSASRPVLIRTIAILGASGGAGPKLREGDRQVPEGLYAIDYLNPNSRHRVSMHLNYPNPEDLLHAQEEGRDRPGFDIMIHGGDTSIGCLAVGDEASEDLFVLAADTGLANIQVILAPWDLRQRPAPASVLPWVAGLYDRVRMELEKLPGRAQTSAARP
jgi:murein L,D-transpeptidase YafK